MGVINYLKELYKHQISHKWSDNGNSYHAYEVQSVEEYGVMLRLCLCRDQTHIGTGEERTRELISHGGEAVSFDKFNSINGRYSGYEPLTEEDKEKVIQNADN